MKRVFSVDHQCLVNTQAKFSSQDIPDDIIRGYFFIPDKLSSRVTENIQLFPEANEFPNYKRKMFHLQHSNINEYKYLHFVLIIAL